MRAALLLGLEHPCGYLPQISARNAYLNPAVPLDPERYGILLEQGFRRGGDYVYRPHCRACQACWSSRIKVIDFTPNRSQRRCWQRNQDLSCHMVNHLGNEHFALYSRYLSARHANDGMDPEDRTAFHQFLECSWGLVSFWEFRLKGRLLACAVVDEVPQALSAVYTFFDPDEAARGLGTLAVLQQIHHARTEQLDWLYLGYWVEASAKMAYKAHFQPQEICIPGQPWQRMAR